VGDLLIILVALCFSEFIHNVIEIWGMRQKVSWLDLSLAGKKHGRWPVNIDTKFKTLVLHILIILISGGGAYLLLKLLNMSNEKLVFIGIVISIVNYICTTWKVDSYHSEIGRIIKNAKNRVEEATKI